MLPDPRPPGFPDDQRLARWLAFASTMSTQHIDYLSDWGHDLLDSDKPGDNLVGGLLLRVCELERERRAGDEPAEG
jgi:hypothetical protein